MFLPQPTLGPPDPSLNTVSSARAENRKTYPVYVEKGKKEQDFCAQNTYKKIKEKEKEKK